MQDRYLWISQKYSRRHIVKQGMKILNYKCILPHRLWIPFFSENSPLQKLGTLKKTKTIITVYNPFISAK